MISGTAFASTSAAVMDIFDTYILDGQQHFIQGSAEAGGGFFYDLSTKGREFVRAPYGNLRFPAAVFANALNCSYFLDGARGSEYAELVARLSGVESKVGSDGGIGRVHSLRSSRHFWRSDYTAHHRPSPSVRQGQLGQDSRDAVASESEFVEVVATTAESPASASVLVPASVLTSVPAAVGSSFSVSLKMDSTRMDNNEVCNGEGLESWHTADGVLLPYVRGDEYEGACPAFHYGSMF
jgi:hypothetical protein